MKIEADGCELDGDGHDFVIEEEANVCDETIASFNAKFKDKAFASYYQFGDLERCCLILKVFPEEHEDENLGPFFWESEAKHYVQELKCLIN